MLTVYTINLQKYDKLHHKYKFVLQVITLMG